MRIILVHSGGKDGCYRRIIPRISSLARDGLLFRIVAAFCLMGEPIISIPGDVVGRVLGADYSKTTMLAFTAASNHFDLAIAVAVIVSRCRLTPGDPMPRQTRYEGAIIRDHELLLIRHRHHDSDRTYWLLPGGGMEDGETEEACVKREMMEETSLDVLVERVLLDQPVEPGPVYTRRKIFICRPLSGVASPGYEPELEAAAVHAIVEVRWFDLRDTQSWPRLLLSDRDTFPLISQIRQLLGYDDPA